MRLGLHISPDPELVSELGIGCCQVFAGSPSSYMINMKAGSKKYGVPTYIHCSYPVFLTAHDEMHKKKLYQYFDGLCQVANEMSANIVTHVGSSYGDNIAARDNAVDLCDFIVGRLQGKLLLENSAGKPSLVGPMEQYLQIMERCYKPLKLAACVDTAHSWGNGKSQMEFLYYTKFVGLVHLNGSTVPFGSGRDVHSWLYRGKTEFDTPELWDILKKLNGDIIVEGSSEEGSLYDEMAYVRDKLGIL